MACMHIHQVFNEYVERGGEANVVARVASQLGAVARVSTTRFSSADWAGPAAPPVWQQALRMYHNPRSVQMLRASHMAEPFDALLAHNVFPVGSAGIFREAFRLGVPVVYYIHNFRPFSVNGYLWTKESSTTAGMRKNYIPEILAGSWQNSRLKTAWYAGLLWTMHLLGYWRRMSAWVAISEFMRAKFMEAGVPGERVFTVRHAWDPRIDEPAFADGDYYLYLGRLIPAKGIKCLIDSWNILYAQLGKRCPHLAIAGEGPLQPWVQQRTSANPAISFRGFVAGADKTRLLAKAKAVVVPSIWWEPLGLVVYEAYDHGKPVLAADSGGLTETVLPGQTGLLHTPGDPHAIVRDVMTVEDNPHLIHRYGRAGREWLLANTRSEDWRTKMMAVFAYAMAHNRSR